MKSEGATGLNWWGLGMVGFSLVSFGVACHGDEAQSGVSTCGDKPEYHIFEKGDSRFSVNAGFGTGIANNDAHEWGLATAEYGHVITRRIGKGHWYEGSLELAGQLFGGGQFEPSRGYIIGVAPVLRYNFTPEGWRVIPFIDGGAGVAATDIRDGNLSTTFEFNSQGGAGVHVLLRRDLAITAQFRFYHISNAGIDSPNSGVNTGAVLVGVSWFF